MLFTLFTLENLLIMLGSYFGSMLFFYQFSKTYTHKKRKAIIVFLDLLIILCLAIIKDDNNNIYLKLLFIFVTCLSLILLPDIIKKSLLPLSIISVSFSFCFEYFGVVLSGTILYFLNFKNHPVVAALLSTAIQLITIILLLKIRRIINWFRLLDKKENFGLGLLLSSYILMFSVLITTKTDYLGNDISAIIFLGIPLALTGLILWIQSIFERYYKRKIADRADAITQQQIADKDEYIQKLETEVATLAKQLHRDNHLLSSLDRSVEALGNNHSETQREQIVEEIHTLFRERNELIAKEQQANKILPSTGIAIIDGALSEMYVKAVSHNISFDLMVGEKIHYLVNNIISQTDLQTLLCDHIKDAIIAIDATDNISGKILVSIEKNDGIFEISIRDNGIGFETDTFAKLGLERVTTHAESGGSGIGFVTTFETLQKTKGSLIITEYENKTPFSKCVTFIFDGLHQFIIQSYRKEELERSVTREDILFL